MSYTNADGLRVLTDGAAGTPAENGLAAVFAKKTMLVNIDLTKGDQALNEGQDAAIPAGSFITSATMVVKTAAAGGTNVTVGLINAAGADIDADGIDAAVATAALAANKAVVCDGDLVGGTATIGAADGYIDIDVTGTYTAGEILLVIEYIEV